MEEDDEDEEDEEDMEDEEEVVPLRDGGCWKCPRCTEPYAYKDKRSAIKHIAKGDDCN